jgi:heme oxygenase (biliverdin-producing, ferredoxin)
VTATMPDTAEPLSAQLRERTRLAHETAENSPFVSRLMAGHYPVEAYVLLAAQHRAIYGALEAVGAGWTGDAVAGPFVLDVLMRSASIGADLGVLLGPGWETTAERMVLPATERYAEHLRTVVTTWAAGYVAHHYVRYLGDLSGGQIVRRGLHAVFGPAVAGATNFYEFADIPKVKPFRDDYRARLDALVLDAAESDRMVAEAVTAFHLNHAVFLDLGERCAAQTSF